MKLKLYTFNDNRTMIEILKKISKEVLDIVPVNNLSLLDNLASDNMASYRMDYGPYRFIIRDHLNLAEPEYYECYFEKAFMAFDGIRYKTVAKYTYKEKRAADEEGIKLIDDITSRIADKIGYSTSKKIVNDFLNDNSNSKEEGEEK